MITLEAYDADKHEHVLEYMLNLHSMPIELAHDLPYIGAIASYNGTPVAVGFIRAVEGSGLGMMDCLISNPESASKVRHEALDALFAELFKLAKESCITKLLAYTADESTVTRACRNGYVILPHTPLLKDL